MSMAFGPEDKHNSTSTVILIVSGHDGSHGDVVKSPMPTLSIVKERETFAVIVSTGHYVKSIIIMYDLNAHKLCSAGQMVVHMDS